MSKLSPKSLFPCEGCGDMFKLEDLTPDYDLMLLCEDCLDELRCEHEDLSDT